jgi:hypothetical protein
MTDQLSQPASHRPDPNPALDLREHIRGVPDFPKPGILFYDISTLLRHGRAWRAAMARLADIVAPHKPDLLAGIESRGFLVAAPLALEWASASSCCASRASCRAHHRAQLCPGIRHRPDRDAGGRRAARQPGRGAG